MECVAGKKVSEIFRETDNGYFMVRLVDESIGFGLTDCHISTVCSKDDIQKALSIVKIEDQDDFEDELDNWWYFIYTASF